MSYFIHCWLTGAGLGLVTAGAAQPAPSPYRTHAALEVPLTLGVGLAAGTGLLLMQRKQGLSPAEQAQLIRSSVPAFDRFAAGKYSAPAQHAGDILCYGTLLAAPGALALDASVRGHYGQVLGMYLESVVLTDALFTLAAGTITRPRPLLYGPDGPERVRASNVALNAFFAGHTAHAATATFFVAQVYHDFHPGSAAGSWVWGVAAALPVVVAATRIEAGKHFLSDNLVGYAVGAASGLLVPRLHKLEHRNLTPPALWGATAATATVFLLPQLPGPHRAGWSVGWLQGVNVNGFAYGGLSATRRF